MAEIKAAAAAEEATRKQVCYAVFLLRRHHAYFVSCDMRCNAFCLQREKEAAAAAKEAKKKKKKSN
jgi:hypothetical protein